ncbi:hypothetical protein AACH06_29760 [Ideonella sp. DXS29W]|uniref:Uncharacterized protein n=1 Tax=Ideonella lacteola TaxID=2984193 RepID=A0ABU9C2V6_9BURK
MISRIPALEFLQRLVGSYAELAGPVKLRVWRCGYGVAIDLTEGQKTILCGVAGAFNQDIEYFVQIGLPNVTRTTGRLANKSTLCLVAAEPPVEFRFTKATGSLLVSIAFNGEEKASYALPAA